MRRLSVHPSRATGNAARERRFSCPDRSTTRADDMSANADMSSSSEVTLNYERPFGGARVQREKRLRLAIAVALATSGPWSSACASALALDPAATRIAFSVKNLSVAYVTGTFRLASGRVVLDDGDLSRSTIEAVIDAGSVDTDEPKRDAHLRSSDFLDVIRYPTIAFRSTRIEPADGDHWKVTGNLTLRGTTRPVVLDVQRSTAQESRPSAHASTTIDRRDFGITYSGYAVGKQVAITIDAVGIGPPAAASPG